MYVVLSAFTASPVSLVHIVPLDVYSLNISHCNFQRISSFVVACRSLTSSEVPGMQVLQFADISRMVGHSH